MGNITKAERARRAEQGNESTEGGCEVEVPTMPTTIDDLPLEPMTPTFDDPKEPPKLADYIAAKEVEKLEIVLVSVTYPGADDRVYPGKYSGVRVTSGQLGCVWSDGSTE